MFPVAEQFEVVIRVFTTRWQTLLLRLYLCVREESAKTKYGHEMASFRSNGKRSYVDQIEMLNDLLTVCVWVTAALF